MVTATASNHSGLSDDLIPSWQLSKDQIERIMPATTLDLLRFAPGVVVTQQGGSGGLSFVSIRGGDPNFTKVLIDGVDVDNPTNSRGGGFDFATIDPASIEKIEVLYGAYSALYGSNGLSGLINIVTKAIPNELEVNGKFSIGSDSHHAQYLDVGGSLSQYLSARISISNRQGAKANSNESLQGRQINFRLETRNIERFSARLGGFFSDVEATAFPEDSGGDRLSVFRLAEVRDLRQNNLYFTASAVPNRILNSKLFVSRSVFGEKLDHPGIASGVFSGVPEFASATRYQRTELRWTNSARVVKDAATVSVGLAHTNESSKNETVINFGFPFPAGFDMSRKTDSFFSELQSNIGGFGFLFGYRWDKIANTIEDTFRVNLSYSPAWTPIRIRYAYSEGFKMPSIFALANPLIANPDLLPEFSKSHEIAIQYPSKNGRFNIGVSAYRNEFLDLIDFDPNLFTNFNRSDVTITGAQVDLKFRPTTASSIDLFVAYTNPNSSEKGVPLRRRPRWQRRVNFNIELPSEFWFRMSLHSQSGIVDSSIPTGVGKLSGFNKFDVFISRQINQSFGVNLSIDNVFNTAYEESIGFSNPGRQIRLGIRASL